MYNSQTETYFPGDSVTTSQGQAVAVSGNSATFNNLGLLQSEAAEQRTYTVYVLTGTAPNNGSGYTFSENGVYNPAFSPYAGTSPAATPLGSGWYDLGTVTLGSNALDIDDLSSVMTVACPSSAGITQVALLMQTTVDTYNADGNLISEIDAAGNTTSYSYNDLGEAAQQPDPSNTAIELGAVYDKAGNLATSTDLMGNTTTYSYDVFGDEASVTLPNPATGGFGGPTTTNAYDADGDLLSETDPLGNVSSCSYDAFGDQVSQSLPNPATGAAGGPTTTSTYDLDGNLLSQTDPLGNVTSYSYDPFGNPVSQSLPNPTTGAAGGPTTTYAYNGVGNMLSLTDPDGNTTSWTYDGLGNETGQSETVALGYNSSHVVQTTTATSSYQYDLAGNLVKATDADGRVIDYWYNAANQETSEQWFTPGAAAAGSVTYSYDTAGDMLGASDYTASGSLIAGYTNQYDGVGNLDAQAITIGGLNVAGPASDVVLSSTYDYNGDRLSLAATLGGEIASGSVVDGTPDFINNYSYDALGDMTDVTQQTQTDLQPGQTAVNTVAAKNAVLSYDGESRLAGVSLYASVDTSVPVASSACTYNDDSRLTDLSYTAQSSTLAAYHWSYDSDSEVTNAYSFKDTSGSPSPSSYSNWADTQSNYDHDGQLTGTSYSGNFVNPPTSSTSQAYDSNGNRTATNGVAETSATDRLLFDGTYYYAYDAAGNRTAKFESTTGALDSTATNITIYQWNNANELTEVSQYANYTAYNAKNATSQVGYAYDPSGQMVSESPAGGTAEYFVNDRQNVALVLNSGGQVLDTRALGAGHPSDLGDGRGDAFIARQRSDAGTVDWDLTDNQGTVRDVAQYNASTQTTSVVNHLVYASYGQIASQTNSADRPTFMYDGMWQDPTTGLDYDDARWYDPVDGVFGSQDPLEFGGGQTNTSEYCGNSPTNATDPSGMMDPSQIDPSNPFGPCEGQWIDPWQRFQAAVGYQTQWYQDADAQCAEIQAVRERRDFPICVRGNIERPARPRSVTSGTKYLASEPLNERR